MKHFNLVLVFFLISWTSSIVFAAADIELELESIPDPLLSGTQNTLIISYENSGSACSNPTMTLLLPEETSFVNASAGGTHDGSSAGGLITWELPTVPPNRSSAVTTTIEITSLLDEDKLDFMVEMEGQNNKSCIEDDDDGEFELPIAERAVIELSKIADKDVVQPDDEITYTIRLENIGNQKAAVPYVVDQLPEGTQFRSTSNEGEFIPGLRRVAWQLDDIDVGDSATITLRLKVDDDIPADSELENCVRAFSEKDPDANDYFQPVETCQQSISPPPTQAILSLNKSAEDTVLIGGELHYEIEYDNIGSNNAENVVITDTYSPLIEQITGASGNPDIDTENRTITWDMRKLTPGESGSFVYTAIIRSGLAAYSQTDTNAFKIDNTAQLTADNADPVMDIHSAAIILPTPDFSLAVSAPQIANPGDLIQYRIDFGNIGSGNAINPILEDIIPQECLDPTASNGGIYNPDTHTMTWTVSILPIGQSGSLTVACTLDAGIANNTEIVNSASIYADNGSPKAAQAVTLLQSKPILTLSKVGNPNPVGPGQQLLYRFEIANQGNASATNVRLADLLDSKTEYITATNGGVYTPHQVTWELGTLAPNTKLDIDLLTQVDGSLTDDVTLFNNATVTSNETNEVSASEQIQVAIAPQLSLLKTTSVETVEPGDELTYSLTFKNTGNADAKGLMLEDFLPINTTYVSSSTNGELVDGVVTWNIGQLAVGQESTVTLTVRINSALADDTLISNTATLKGTGIQPITVQKNVLVNSRPILSLTKSTDKTVVSPNEQITFSLKYENTGNANADNVILTDTLPTNTRFVSATGGGTESNGVVTWSDPSLEVGAKGEVSVTVQVNNTVQDGELIHNSASINSDGTSPIAADADVLVKLIPILEISKIADKSFAQSGESVTYQINFQNVGNTAATQVQINDLIPQNTTFISASGNYEVANGIVTWTEDSLSVGQGGQFSLTVQINPGVADDTVIKNIAEIKSEQTRTTLTSVDITVKNLPQLTLTKTADQDFVQAGGSVTFTLHYENVGNADALNVVLEDAIPAGTSFISASGGGVLQENKVVWSDPNLEAGAFGDVLLTLGLDDDLADGTQVQNTANINSDGTAPVTASDSVTVKRTPVLQLSKAADVEYVSPGQQFTYTLTFSNVGNAAANEVIIEDPIPQNLSYISSSGGEFANGVVSWSFDTLSVGENGQLTLTVQVDDDKQAGALEDGQAIVNHATMDSIDAYAVTAQDTVIVQLVPQLTLTKKADRDFVEAGDNVNYTLHYENIGNADALNVVMEDPLPPGTSFVSATGGGVLQGDKVVWSDPNLQAGAIGEVLLKLKLDDDLADDTVVQNIANIDSDGTVSVSASDAVTVKRTPNLFLQKVSDVDFVAPGQQFTYTITFGNDGNAAATDVTIEDNIPQDLSYVSSSGGEFADGKVIWRYDSLSAGDGGSLTLTVQVDEIEQVQALEDGQVILNYATIDSVDAYAVTARDEVIVQLAPQMTLTKTADRDVVEAGGQVTYTLNYANIGNAAAENLVLADQLPPQTRFISATGGGTLEGNTVTWTDAQMEANESVEVLLTLQINPDVADGTNVLNAATLSSDNTLSISANDTVTVQRTPVLSLEQDTIVEFVSPGEEYSYRLDYANIGNAAANAVVLENPIPDDTSFVSATSGGQFVEGKVTWTTEQLPTAVEGSVYLTVKVDDLVDNGSIIRNKATLDSSDAYAVSAEDTVIIQFKPKLVLTKSADRDQVEAGGSVTFTLHYENTGNADAPNVVLEDPIPAGTSFLSASGGGVLQGDKVVWTDPNIKAGSMGEVLLTLKLDDDLADGTQVQNSASIDSDATNPVTASDSITVKRTPLLQLTKQADVEFVSPGQQFTYTLSFSNIGNATANDVIIEDPIPQNLSYVSSSGGEFADGKVTWRSDTLSIGQTGSVTLTVQVEDDDEEINTLQDGQVIVNHATLDSVDANAVSAQDSVTVQLLPQLTLTKKASQDFVEAGDNVTFTLSYENIGNADALNVVLEDSLPIGTSFVSATGGGVLEGNKVVWTDPNLQVGANGEVLLKIQLDDDLADDTRVENIAYITSDDSQPVTASDTVTVTRTPWLRMRKDSDVNFVAPGQQFTYTLSFGNDGNASATEVTIEDNIPQHLSYVSSSGGEFADGKVTWRRDSLAVGESGSVTLTVQVVEDEQVNTLEDGQLILNYATIDSVDALAVTARDEVIVQLAPQLTLSKLADRDVVDAGGQVTYTLSYANTGNAAAENIILEDQLPPQTSFVSASGGGTLQGNRVIWTDPSIEANESAEVLLTLQINSDVPDGSNILNTAILNSNNTLSISANDTVTVQRSPVLSLAQDSFVEYVSPGEQYSYQLDYANIGNAAANEVVLENPIPDDTSFVSATSGGQFANGKVTWTAEQLPTATDGSVYLTVKVDSADLVEDGSIIRNKATLDSSDAYAVSAEADVIVQFEPKLSLDKTTDKEFAQVGDLITYQFRFENTGNAEATQLVLIDELPSSTTFVSATGGGHLTGNSVIWNRTRLASGESGEVLLTVQVNDGVMDGTLIVNQARMHSAETLPVTDTEEVLVKNNPVLNLTKTTRVEFVTPGQQMTYSLSFSNTGNARALDVILEDTFSEHTTFVSASDGGTFADGKVTWAFNQLPIGAQGTVTLTVRVDELADVENGTIIRNHANLDSANATSVSAENNVIVRLLPKLSLTKTANADNVEAGKDITFTLHYENSGNAAATNLILEDTIPDNTSFVSATGGGILSGDKVVWSDPNLDAGAMGRVHLTVNIDPQVADGTTILNQASMRADNANPVWANKQVSVMRSPVLTLVKTADVNFALPGQQFNYILTVANQGNAPATQVVLEDPIPQYTQYVSSTGGIFENGKVTWRVDSLPVGTESSVTLTVKVDDFNPFAPIPDGTPIQNFATLNSVETEAISADNTIPIQILPKLTLTKAADTQLVEAGETVTYTLRFGNTGNGDATGVILTDPIPENMRFIAATGGGVKEGNNIIWDIQTLPIGSQEEVLLTLRVDSTVEDGIIMTNIASIDSNTTLPVTATSEVEVKRKPLLSLSKISDKESVSPGEQLTYTLSFNNTGNANAVSVLLEDPIPENTTFVAASSGGELIDGKVTWRWNRLPIDGQGQVTFTVQVDDAVLTSVEDGDLIYNHASLDAANAYAVSAEKSVVVNYLPKLMIEKSSNSRSVEPSEEVIFTLAYENIGLASAGNVVLIDYLPSHTEFISATGGGVLDGNKVVWNASALEPGESGEVHLRLRINSDVEDGMVLTNSALLSSEQTNPVYTHHQIIVERNPGLSLIKTASTKVVSPGQQLSYILKFANNGNADAINVVLEDPVPEYTSFISAPGGELVDGKVIWKTDKLAVGASGEVFFTVRVEEPGYGIEKDLSDGQRIINRASLDSDNADAVSAETIVHIRSLAQLQLIKSANIESAEIGDLIQYTLAFKNTGNSSATQLLLRDQLPQYTRFISATGGGELEKGQVSWFMPLLQAGEGGEVSLTVQVTEQAENTALITNFASLESQEVPPVMDNVQVKIITKPSLQLNKNANPSQVQPGETITYHLNFANNGNATANHVMLEDPIPEHTTFISATGGGVLNNNKVLWDLSDIAAGDSGEVTFTVRVDSLISQGDASDEVTIIRNKATLSSNNSSSVIAEENVVVDPQGELSLEKGADKEIVSPGERIIYYITFANTGTQNITDLDLVDQLPADTQFVSATAGGVEDNGKVFWKINQLSPGASGSVSLTVKVNNTVENNTTIHNSAILTAGTQVSPASAAYDVRVSSQPSVSLNKTADKTFVQPNDELSYTIAFSNIGKTELVNLILTDDLPSETEFISASNGGRLSNNVENEKVIWELGNLSPGEKAQVSLKVKINGGVKNDQLITNTASIDSDGQSAPKTDQARVRVRLSPVLSLTKLVSAEYVMPGETITYTLQYENKGNATANNLLILDAIPENARFVSASQGAVESNGVVSWQLGSLEPETSGSVTLSVMVEEDTPTLTVLHNAASLDSAELPPIGSHKDVLVYTMDSLAKLEINITGQPDEIEPGGEIHYQINFSNLTRIPAKDAVVVGGVPENTQFISASHDGELRENGESQWLQWEVGELAAKETGQVTFIVRHIDENAVVIQGMRANPGNQPTTIKVESSIISLAAIDAENIDSPQATLTSNSVKDKDENGTITPIPVFDYWSLLLLIVGIWFLAKTRLKDKFS